MKRILPIILLTAALIASCKDKIVYCSEDIVKVPSYVGLAGFSPAEAGTIIINEYEADHTYRHLLKTDTLVTDSLSLVNDTLMRNGNLFITATIYEQRDYEVLMPQTASAFRITGLHYSGDTVEHYTLPSGACRYRGFFNAADSCLVNGINTALTFRIGAPSYLFLRR